MESTQARMGEKQSAAKLAVQRADTALKSLKAQVRQVEEEFANLTAELKKYAAIDQMEAREFLKEPWCILPKSRSEWWVVIPKWVGVQVGWLERTTETYNVFVVNRYSHWIGNVPQGLRDELKLPAPFESEVDGGKLRTTAELPKHLKGMLSKQIKQGTWKIKRGREYELMAALIELGSLPFKPRPVAEGDLRDVKLAGILSKLRDYQKEGWEEFLRHGAVGIYWPWGQGKTVFGLYAIARLKGEKIIVCPTVMLVEQWQSRLQKWMDLGLRHDVEVVTYQAWERLKNRKPKLLIFDECHRLPANTFSRLATLQSDYRIGLSATPYREDGRTNLIFALTGKPVGVDWVDFIRSGRITIPHVEVRIVHNWTDKIKETQEEVKRAKGSVLIFCDAIDRGKALASRLGVPFVYGDSKKRLETIESSKIVVCSRVGDEGLSIPDLTKVIEVDFLGSSRRQESQRVGRLFHAEGKGQHIVMMTQDEWDRFEHRFLALEEKGFKVNVRPLR